MQNEEFPLYPAIDGPGEPATKRPRQWTAEVRTPRGSYLIGPFESLVTALWFGQCLVGYANHIILRELVRPEEVSGPGLAVRTIRPLPHAPA